MQGSDVHSVRRLQSQGTAGECRLTPDQTQRELGREQVFFMLSEEKQTLSSKKSIFLQDVRVGERALNDAVL